MTPKDLFDIADRINEAVPGLVPELTGFDIERNIVWVWQGQQEPRGVDLEARFAAAMMLGLVRTWLDHPGNMEAPHAAMVFGCAVALRAYVSTTLPGYKP